MNKNLITLSLLAIVLCSTVSASEKDKKTEEEKVTPAYVFTDTHVIPVTPVKNQASSGTCWCYSTMGMVEADILKATGKEVDLSEMWVVRYTYLEKVLKYVRMHGKTNLSPGGNAHDVPNMIAKYGIVPESEYRGLNYGTELNKHGEIDAIITSYANTIIRNPNKELSTAWVDGLNAILDTYFGKPVEKFTVDSKEYTPKEYAAALGINPSDYISVTSFTHHPFGTSFPVEIPDNWAWGESINVPIDEMLSLTESAVEAGYTISWGSDVSDKGFKYKDLFAVLPETEVKNMTGSDQAKWTGAKAESIYEFKEIVPEVEVTQESRQKDFDNYTMTDDHGMLILGFATDQKGNKYFKVKNSWGESNDLKGFFYTSYPFFKGRTINVMFNKNALSAAQKAKLNID